jgi:hypothetical protein
MKCEACRHLKKRLHSYNSCCGEGVETVYECGLLGEYREHAAVIGCTDNHCPLGQAQNRADEILQLVNHGLIPPAKALKMLGIDEPEEQTDTEERDTNLL